MENHYTCAFCGKQYNTIEERMKCESQCLKTKKEEEALKKAMKENEGRINSEKQIHETLDKADRMIKDHLNEYGSFSLNHSYYYLSYIFRKINWWF